MPILWSAATCCWKAEALTPRSSRSTAENALRYAPCDVLVVV
jgi:hypothetical protein